MNGIPIFNVNNNCSTGASALLLAKQIIESGNAECVLAVGFEKMERGSLSAKVTSLDCIRLKRRNAEVYQVVAYSISTEPIR